MNIINVNNPCQVPVKSWVWCKGQSPESAVMHVASKFNVQPAVTVYAFWDSIAVPLEIEPAEFWQAMSNEV